MIDIQKFYDKEKQINEIFKKKYNYNDRDIFNKQVLQLSVELSELAYETKCFKYWKDDKASDSNAIASEYADCLMVTLCFCDLAKLEINEVQIPNEKDIVKQFLTLNKLSSQINTSLNKGLLTKILGNLLNLSTLLQISDKEMNNHINAKMDATLKMHSTPKESLQK